jgi:mRNA interferase MazF
MKVEQGGIYWVDFGEARSSGPGYRRPCVVVQNDIFNASRLQTVVVCVLSSNLRLAKAPGNVLLQPDEINLPKPRVANITQLITVDKDSLEEKVATLPKSRIYQILRGIFLLLEP